MPDTRNIISKFWQDLKSRKVLPFLIIASVVLFWCMDSVAESHPGLRVAMVQMNILDGNLAENMLSAEKSIREAAGKKADLICLPETADFGWLYQNAREHAQPIPGKYTDFLSGLARELNVWISAGSSDDIKVVDTEFGRIGLTICADNFDIANPQKVSDMGAWLLVTPHGYAEKESDLVDNAVSFMNHIKKIAGTTELWVIGTDASLSLVTGGAWKGHLHSGGSTIADPTGKAVAIGKVRETDLVIYDIPPEK